jgi:hypothetical protein
MSYGLLGSWCRSSSAASVLMSMAALFGQLLCLRRRRVDEKHDEGGLRQNKKMTSRKSRAMIAGERRRGRRALWKWPGRRLYVLCVGLQCMR